MESFRAEKLCLDGGRQNCELDIIEAEKIVDLVELHIMGMDGIMLANPDLFTNLHNLVNLRTLSISRGNVSSNNIRTISNFIAGSALSKLELLDCTIENSALTTIINSTKGSAMRTINFEHLFFDKGASEAMVDVIENSTLDKLSFMQCTFHHEGFILIMNAIKESTLKTLMLERGSFGVLAITCIADCIVGSKLTKLSLLGSAFGAYDHTILRAIKQSSVKTLNVLNIQFYSNFNIANDLIANGGITKLKFDQYRSSIDEKLEFINVVQKNRSSEHISLCYVEFTDQLLTRICCLLENASLKNLELNYCSFPDAALDKIIDSIKRSSIVSIKFTNYNPQIENIISIQNLLENCYLDKLKLNFFDATNNIVDSILPSIMQSSITKFSTHKFGPIEESLREKIDNALQVRRHQIRNRANMKSARFLY